MTRTPEGLRAEGTPEDFIEGMLAARQKVEDNYGVDNLGSYDDFEWSMINGKLSALALGAWR